MVSHALVALMVLVSLGPALHTAWAHDADCDPVVVVHDASQHRISGAADAASSVPSDHCVACHLFRSVRIAGEWRFVQQRPDTAHHVHHAERDLVPSRPSTPLPARAPPVLG
jgi:hypothetical protein